MADKQHRNVAVSKETHDKLVKHIESVDGKIGKFVDKAINDRLTKENSGLSTLESKASAIQVQLFQINNNATAVKRLIKKVIIPYLKNEEDIELWNLVYDKVLNGKL